MSILAAFIHPGILWGLGLVSVPILIHLITRRRYRIVDWAAMEFLLEAERKSRRRIRIENLILLLTRMALIGLIPLALARPMASALGLGWLAGAFRSEERIIAIDDSMSMGHVEAGRSALDRARGAVVSGLEGIAGRAAREEVTIVRSSRPDEPLRRNDLVDRDKLPKLQKEIEAIEGTATRLSPERLAGSLADIVAEDASGVGRSVVIVSDFRRADWSGSRDAIRESFRRLAGDPDNPVRLLFVDVGSADRENLAVTDLRVSRNVPVVGVPLEITVTVTNYGTMPARAVRAFLKIGEAEVPGSPIPEIPAGESRTVDFLHVYGDAGSFAMEGRIEQDRLEADNRRTRAVEVLEAVRVLLVDGSPSAKPFESETDFLAAALDPGGDVTSGVRPDVITDDRLGQTELDAYDIVALANVASVGPIEAEKLEAYVRGGGGLVIFAGDQVNPRTYNANLRSLLPAALGELIEPVASSEEFFHLRPALDHPALRQLRGDAAVLLEHVDVAKFYGLEPGPDARILLRLSDAAESPAIVECDRDRGRVVLCATTADRDWTDWPRHPSYLVFLHDLVPYVGRARGAERNVPAGAPIIWPVDVARYVPEAALRGPRYPDEPEGTLRAETESAAEGEESRFILRVPETHTAGRYELWLTERSGGKRPERFAVGADPAESDLEPAGEARLRDILGEIPFQYMRDPSALGTLDAGRWELSWVLVIAFIALALVEMFLAWTFGKRGGS